MGHYCVICCRNMKVMQAKDLKYRKYQETAKIFSTVRGLFGLDPCSFQCNW